jgi:hypothetical protein
VLKILKASRYLGFTDIYKEILNALYFSKPLIFLKLWASPDSLFTHYSLPNSQDISLMRTIFTNFNIHLDTDFKIEDVIKFDDKYYPNDRYLFVKNVTLSKEFSNIFLRHVIFEGGDFICSYSWGTLIFFSSKRQSRFIPMISNKLIDVKNHIPEHVEDYLPILFPQLSLKKYQLIIKQKLLRYPHEYVQNECRTQHKYRLQSAMKSDHELVIIPDYTDKSPGNKSGIILGELDYSARSALTSLNKGRTLIYFGYSSEKWGIVNPKRVDEIEDHLKENNIPFKTLTREEYERRRNSKPPPDRTVLGSIDDYLGVRKTHEWNLPQ